MSDHSDTARAVVKIVRLVPNSDLEHLIVACADLTWNQVFLELDRFSRSGRIVLRQISPGRYSVTPGHGAASN
jgi:hypothetical protein